MKNLPLQFTKLVLLALSVYLAYALVQGIAGPVQFDKESRARYEVMEKKMEKIRDAQFAHKDVKGYYAPSFDSLEMVILNDSLSINKQIIIDRSEYDKAEHGPNPKIYDDTTKYIINYFSRVSIKDSLFNNSEYTIEDLRKIPFSEKPFYMTSGEIDAAGGRYQIPVFEVTAPNKYFLAGLAQNYFEPDFGYRLGSMFEANTEIARVRGDIYYPEE